MWITIISIVAIVLSAIAITLSCVGLSIIVGLKNSTHKIEWMPVPEPEVDRKPEAENNNSNVNQTLEDFKKLYEDDELDHV